MNARTLKGRKNYYAAEEVRLVRSGNDYFDTLSGLIRSAMHTLHFQTYIFDDDETGRMIAEELKQAASRGVKTYVLIDSFGSNAMSEDLKAELRLSGVYLRMFAPFFSRNTLHLGRRMHHKIMVADSNTALVGGINIADKYRGSEQEPAWLDFAVLVKGKVCLLGEKICQDLLEKKFIIKKDRLPQLASEGKTLVRFRRNDRLRGKHQVSQSYHEAFRSATDSITLVSSYFLPGKRIRRALKKAATRGVKVTIILAGKSDAPLLTRASNYLYRTFLLRGIDIYEWQVSVLHGKLALVDDEWATIGSFNLNHLSALSSIELNVDVVDKAMTDDIKKHIAGIIREGCKKVDPADYTSNCSRWTRFVNASAYFLSRTGMRSLGLFPKIFGSREEEQL